MSESPKQPNVLEIILFRSFLYTLHTTLRPQYLIKKSCVIESILALQGVGHQTLFLSLTNKVYFAFWIGILHDTHDPRHLKQMMNT